MINQEDTISAIVTPSGIGGISVIRLSGKEAISIASKVFHKKSGKSLTDVESHTIHYGYITDPVSGKKLDEVLVSVMKAPRSFTCEDVIEVSCHGGPLITTTILETFLRAGARLAEPGEFTKRAFLNGRIDLAQAEAVIEIIRAKTEEGLKCALWQLEGKLSNDINKIQEDISTALSHIEAYIDFPEEDAGVVMTDIEERVKSALEGVDRLLEGYFRWRPLREGILTAIIGRTNVGKSSLLNVLTGEERAIVTPHPGTTRDIIESMINISGLSLRLLDTAGLRMTEDLAEEEGIKRMYRAAEMAELVLIVLDGSEALKTEDIDILTHTKNKKRVIVINKIDLDNQKEKELDAGYSPIVYTSVVKGEGIEELKNVIRQTILGKVTGLDEGAVVNNIRHKTALENAGKELESFIESVRQELPLEIQALHLRSSMNFLGEITGVVTTEDILDRIFNEFCIGK